MKTMKYILSGTAASILAMPVAQAADLPVKAKPVEYVKVCSLYGEGFYYIPGTDMCLKIGGYMRQQIGYGINGNLTLGGNASNQDTRGTQNFAMRSRGYITADARNQTEYGTVRSYIAVGFSSGGAAAGTVTGDPPSGAAGFSANRAFVQFAGFTFGISQSFYDFYNGAATAYFGGGAVNISSDTGDTGKQVAAYTAQLGNGLSASISIEGQRNSGVIGPVGAASTAGTVTTAATPVALPGSAQRAMQYPDIAGNIRVDQTWGSAQLMAAVHDATGTYIGSNTATGNAATATGYALGGGIKLFAPMIAAGDYFQGQFNYTVGAYGYANVVPVLFAKYNGGAGGSYGYGLVSDSVYGANGSVDLTTTWIVNAAYEHFWSKSWQTSLYGSYAKTSYSANANANLCAVGGVTSSMIGAAGAASAGCNNNFALWNIGSRTQWNVDSQTSMGIDVVYQRLQTASAGVVTTVPAVGTQPAGVRAIADQGTWMGQFRIHRNFYP